jgi:hypothetical protein
MSERNRGIGVSNSKTGAVYETNQDGAHLLERWLELQLQLQLVLLSSK